LAPISCIQAENPRRATSFYIEQLGFTTTGISANLVSLQGKHINLFIERGPAWGPVLEVTFKHVQRTKDARKSKGCEIVKNEPGFPRYYVKDANGQIYNLRE
jgi:hypothetical protein